MLHFLLTHPSQPHARRTILARLAVLSLSLASVFSHTQAHATAPTQIQNQANVTDTTPLPSRIRIGLAHGSFGSPPRSLLNPLTIAQHHALVETAFAETGIAIQWIYFKGAGPAVNEAIANHQIDFALQGDLPSIVGRAAGLKTQLLLPLSQANTYVIVRNDSAIKSLTDLTGKRLAFHKGTNMHVSVNKILGAAGLQESDIKFFNLDTIASVAAFHSGDLDGMFGGINLLHLVDKGQARLVYSSAGEDYSITRTNLLGTEQFIQRYPQLTQKLVTALVRAVHHISEPANFSSTLALWQYGNISSDIIERDLNGRRLSDKFSPLFDERYYANLQDSIAVAASARLTRRPVEIDNWVAPQFLTAALQTLQLEHYWQALPRAEIPNLRAHNAHPRDPALALKRN